MQGRGRKGYRTLGLAVAGVSALSLPDLTRGADLVFSGATNGDWNSSTNWTPTGPPGPSDRADIAGGKTVTISISPVSPVDTFYLGGNADTPSPNDNATSNTSGSGTLNQTAGNLVVNTRAVLGSNSSTGANAAHAGAGTYNLSGGTFTVTGTDVAEGTDNFTIGRGGTGTFNVSGNAAVTINSLMNLGQWSGAAGTKGAEQGRGNGTVVQAGNSTVTINGMGLDMNGKPVTTALNIGLNGDGSYILKDNATLTPNLDVNVGQGSDGGGATGVLTQTGGVLNETAGWFYIAASAKSTGTYNLSGGTATLAGRLLVGAQGTGTVNQTGGNITVGTVGGINEDLAIGDVGTGVYNISSGSVTANGGLYVGEWNNGSGTLNISGSAVVNANNMGVARNQAVDPTLSSTTGVVNQTGGTVNIQDHLILGMDEGQNSNGNTTGTYTLSGGQLNLGKSGLQLGGTGQTNPGATGIFNLKGGVLEANQSNLLIGVGAGTKTAFNMTGGTLRNAAQIQFPLNQQGGTLEPGDPGKPATLTITGDGTTGYTLASGATLHLEIAGGKQDQVMATGGSTTLTGLLDVLVSGKPPAHSASLTVLTADSLSGKFSNAPADYASPQGLFHVGYTSTTVSLSGFSLPGDANEDGSVNFSDLVALAAHYGQSGGWTSGDFNQDQKVGFDDLVILAAHYGQNNLTAAFTWVPEPVSLTIPLFTAGALYRRMNRRKVGA